MSNSLLNEKVAMLALSRVQASQLAVVRRLLEVVGSAKELLENAENIHDIIPDVSPRLGKLIGDRALVDRAWREMEFI